MAITRSTPAERKRSRIRIGSRSPGTIHHLAASACVVLGLVLVYQAKTHSFAETEERLKNNTVLNINGALNSADLLPFLTVFSSAPEKQFTAQKIYDYMTGADLRSPHRREIANVGELGKIRVRESEVASKPQLNSFRSRLDEVKHKGPPTERNGELTLALLTAGQLRELKPKLVVREPKDFRGLFWRYAIFFLMSFSIAHIVWRVKAVEVDSALLPIIEVLTGVGLITMVSLRDPLRDMAMFTDFAQGIIGGLILMVLVSFVNFHRSRLRKLSFIPLLASFLLSMALILFGSGPGMSDARVNLLGFQPVEAIRILVVLFLAGYFAGNWEFLRDLKEKRAGVLSRIRWLNIPRLEYLLPVVVSMLLVLAFFYLQKDLGPALVLSFLFLALYGIARRRFGLVSATMLMVIAVVWLGYRFSFPATVAQRIQMWLSPWDNTVHGGDHLAHSLWALSTGGFSGTGLGLGDPAYVPAAHTDLIGSAVGEELGFAGLLTIFIFYAALIYRCVRIAIRAPGDYTFFLAIGLTLVTALQIILIAGGTVGLIPLSGVVLPFLSYGKTSMLANFVVFGILLSISAHPERKEGREFFGRPVMWVGTALALVTIAVLAKAAYVQVVRSDEVLVAGTLAVQADGSRRYQYNPRIVDVARSIPRGSILDRNGIPLATSRWEELESHRAEYAQLGVYIDQACSRSETRHYAMGGLSFHLLGDLRTRINWAADNTSFVERDSNTKLQGYDDQARTEQLREPRTGTVTYVVRHDYRELIPLLRNRYHQDDEAVRRVLARNRDVRMSIDARLTMRVAEILREQIQKTRTEKGAAIVLDPATGDLLASVSYPWPGLADSWADSDDEISDSADEGLIDRARWGIKPPGSTFKLVTAVAALRRDRNLTRETFECKRLSDGRVGNYIRGSGRPIRDDVMDRTPHGIVNMERGIIKSCNAYFAQLGVLIGAQSLFTTSELLGMEFTKRVSLARLRDALPQASYGQGPVYTTPFQMARVAAMIANGGDMAYGRWVIDESNERNKEPQPILSGELAAVLAGYMRGVVTSGTGARLSSSPVPIAGKTGTAEIEDGRSHAWFAGFAPYGANVRKRIAFCILIENGQYGGTAAAPAAGKVVAAARELEVIH